MYANNQTSTSKRVQWQRKNKNNQPDVSRHEERRASQKTTINQPSLLPSTTTDRCVSRGGDTVMTVEQPQKQNNYQPTFCDCC